ncbi:hypothetical protein [Hymenobacter sp. B1770]|uniref:hypothetical protein n=1 Tax=Hymenobacter sp. B1770 TaxID=1718788 RepID=UPI003CEB1376
MKNNLHPAESPRVAIPHATFIDLDVPDSVRAACASAQALGPAPHRPSLHVDCHHLRSQRTLGVSHVVSQLLLLRRGGTAVWLHRVNAPLRRCLRLLHLHSLFYFVEPEQDVSLL